MNTWTQTLCGAATIALVALAPRPVHADGAAGKTIFTTNVVRGFVSIQVNGKPVGRFGKASVLGRDPSANAQIDVSRFARPGSNTVQATWSSPVTGSVRMSHQARGQAPRELVTLRFDVTAKPSGSQTATFVLPDAAGRMGTTPGEVATSGRRARPGSQANQTVVTASLARGNVTVFLNNRQVGKFSAGGTFPLDVSPHVRVGQNTLRLAWNGAAYPIGFVRVAHAVGKNEFKTRGQIDLGVRDRNAGSKSLTFTLPTGAR